MLFKKMLRTVWRYKSQFISMIIMVALGVGIFLGFNMEWISLDADTSKFMEQAHFADYRVVSKDGFTAEDAQKIAGIEGVERSARYLSVNADVDGTENMLGLTVTEKPDVSDFVLIEGEKYDPESTDGMWLSDKYAEKNGIRCGDELALTYSKLKVTGVVKGLVESAEYMICVRDESQLMPDFSKYGYVYVSPVLLENAVSKNVETEVDKAAKDELNKYLGDVLAEELYKIAAKENYAEAKKEVMEKLYPQINVISPMDKNVFSEAVDKALGKTVMVLSRDENVSYAESQGEVQEGQTMGAILPVLFLLIAVLTMVTTMHRLAANEKTQIGTLKALGFKDRRILWHYTTFALTIGVIGSLLGVGLGFGVARLIMNPYGMMGTYIIMPDWTIILPLWCWGVVLLMIGFLTLIGFLSTRQMLRGTAADALRPYSPKKMKRLAIERIWILDKLSFGTKWNLRDILRHKSRSFMSLFGVIGCTVLIVAAMGMNDTMGAFMDTYYKNIAKYSSRIYLNDDVSDKKAAKLAEKYDGDFSASVSVKMNDNPYSLDVYNIKKGLLGFIDENGKEINLPDNGALICVRIRDEYGLQPGDTITVSPYGTDEKYELKVAGVNRSMSESISVSEKYASGIGLTECEMYRVNSVYTDISKDGISGADISSVQSKQDIVDSMDGFMEIMYTGVILLIVAAALLGVIVLYNLGVMSFTERYREMATLKVVGFKDRQIGRLLISQNLWLSFAGILIGIPAGFFTLAGVMKLLASEYEMSVVISPLSYLISFASTMLIALAVGLVIARKNKKIEPVSALKAED